MIETAISALRTKLGVDRHELAAMLDVTPDELLQVERGLSDPPSEFSEKLEALDAKADLVRRVSSESLYARRVGISVTEGATIASIALLFGIAIHEPDADPVDSLVVGLLILTGAIALAVSRGLFPRCGECSSVAYWWHSRCPGCNRVFD